MSLPEQYLEQFAQTCGMDASAAILWALRELSQLRARVLELERCPKPDQPIAEPQSPGPDLLSTQDSRAKVTTTRDVPDPGDALEGR